MRPSSMVSDSVIELVANPKRAAALAERERAARRGAPGWLGIQPRYDVQGVLRLGDGLTEIEAHPRSPAYRAGLRNGDVVGSISVPGIGRIPLEKFYTQNLPARTEVGVEFYRPGATGPRAGVMMTTLKLVPWPRTRQWELRPRVAPGPRVLKKDRAKFLADMIPYLQEVCGAPRNGEDGERRTAWCTAYAFLSFLALTRDNDDNAGVWGRQNDTARHLGLSVRTINDLAQMLCWAGVLRRLSYPTRLRDSNLYEVTRPLLYQTATQPPPVPAPPSGSVRRVRLNALRAEAAA
jgi:hypothetical protein